MAQVKCVYGAPCSGKSSYVREHFKDGDIAWDYDEIKRTITLKSIHSKGSDAQNSMIKKLRYTFAKNCQDIDCDTAWFITTSPSDTIKSLLGPNADYIEMDTTEEECYQRLENDDSREDKEGMRKLIYQYFHADEKKEKAMDKKEIRAFEFEVRAEQNEERGNFLTGQPIVYDERTDLGWYDEIIDDGALDDTDLRDVRFLVNHNTDMIPLARSRNNNVNSTMQLEVKPGSGMGIRVDLDTENNAEAKGLYSAVERGDITGMSFMFAVGEDRWEDIDTDHPTRHILRISKVYEVSAVTFPAYEATSIQARGLSEALESAKESLESVRAKALEVERERTRLRMKLGGF